ncbi:carboxypeptidase regulatory-like domain-containing protein [Natronolimnohabitans sp. A-GB9]|uniref:carboxypeptidase regulatory-like domain-containing protein n=1 Tax=Natronolimnohabitans sp. A-GB9 TaxID=3069757 RepID=UPI0027B0A9C3|nr:carboxypeptidase regulatory-like domain-containing protein [Natronolimnohabitans sp. A-GB9]MDQ2052308.1 carboxypeptidase regulatory-like domain-containing protein [Natronolimnohabitans sp. A-GB9]
MQVERPLVLEVSRKEVLVGRPIVVRVRDSGNRPIEGAIVEAGSKRRRTDERGRCEITFHSPGFWRIVAAKSPTERVTYEPDVALIRALPRSTSSRPARRSDLPSV